MKRKLILMTLVVMVMGLAACNSAKQKETLANTYQTDNVTIELDEAQFQKSMAIYWTNYLGKRNLKNQTEDIVLGANSFRIIKSAPVQLGNNVYFAVRVGLRNAKTYNLSPPFPMNMVVDPTGKLVLPQVVDLAENEEPILSRVPEISQPFYPKGLTETEMLQGPTGKELVFISDPFCGYCRKGYQFISNNMDNIKSVKVVHNPLFPHLGSAVASWVMEYAAEKGIKKAEVFKFSYTKLQKASPKEVNGKKMAKAPKEVGAEILNQYKKVFPELFAHTNGDVMAFYEMLAAEYSEGAANNNELLAEAQLTVTPLFVIDGKVIRGLKTKEISSELGLPIRKKVSAKPVKTTGGD